MRVGAISAVAEQQQVQKLKARDQEVRAHEAAHAAAAGPHASGAPSFTYQVGPDGRSYAVGGEVQIDVSPVEGDPEATIRKMQTVRAAALAPADPSSQDRAVAALASQQLARAQAELSQQNSATSPGTADATTDTAGPSQGATDAQANASPNAPPNHRELGQELGQALDLIA